MTSNGVGTCGPDDNQAQAGHLIVQSIRQGRAESEISSKEGVADTLRAGDGGSSRNALIAITTVTRGGDSHVDQ